MSFINKTLHNRRGDVKIPEFLELSDLDIQSPLVYLPDQLGTVDPLIRPSEIMIIGPTFKRLTCFFHFFESPAG